jgi:hypothetical protein
VAGGWESSRSAESAGRFPKGAGGPTGTTPWISTLPSAASVIRSTTRRRTSAWPAGPSPWSVALMVAHHAVAAAVRWAWLAWSTVPQPPRATPGGPTAESGARAEDTARGRIRADRPSPPDSTFSSWPVASTSACSGSSVRVGSAPSGPSAATRRPRWGASTRSGARTGWCRTTGSGPRTCGAAGRSRT